MTFANYINDVTEWDDEAFVDDILRGPVVWFDGCSEIGPRALGHRSVLGDPTNPAIKDALNRIKQRQWWRPVAPIVLEDAMGDWFENAAAVPVYAADVHNSREPRGPNPSRRAPGSFGTSPDGQLS